ncbi:MAG TPA: metal-dependent hydrolase [Chitinophagales bacterium]|nr:metal-dependent hydrolase [Chitinophagales bacterium]
MMDLTYYGHSCFSILTGKHRLLFDPFISGNPLAALIDPTRITADFIFVSHAHGDHIGDALEIGKRNNAILISNFEVQRWFEEKGLKDGYGLNHGGKLKLDFGTARYVNAIHSSQFRDGTYGGNPGGFLIESDEGNFYFAGDTALTMDMKLIPMFCKLKFSMLPIGGYFTMDYSDAIFASDFLECNKIIGMHFDSFPPIKINHEKAIDLFASKGKELVLMKIGETISV